MIFEEYINKTENRELSESQRETLNRPISQEEIQDAINATKVGKVPGTDGYTAKFYRRFKGEYIKFPWQVKTYLLTQASWVFLNVLLYAAIFQDFYKVC